MIKVSVIVPVYNAEKHLMECLNSIVNQTLKNIEIVIINDGSTDASRKIIEKFRYRDNRIIVIDSDNEGVSNARNYGIRKSKGEFICFVDSDDYLDLNCYNYVVHEMESSKSDWGVFNVNLFPQKPDKNPRLRISDKTINLNLNRDVTLENMLAFKYDYANWNKIYRRETIIDNQLFFESSLKIGEDLLFNLMYLQYASRLRVIDRALYNYRIHSSSAMANSKSIGNEYNLLYTSFITFCDERKLINQKRIFRLDRSLTWIGNIFHFLELSSLPHNSFYTKWKRFKTELTLINKDVYSLDQHKNLNTLHNFYLKNNFFGFIAFQVLFKKMIRKYFFNRAINCKD